MQFQTRFFCTSILLGLLVSTFSFPLLSAEESSANFRSKASPLTKEKTLNLKDGIRQKTSTEEQKTAYRNALRLVEGDYNEAILAMESYVQTFPQSDLADNALYWIAQLYIQKNEFQLAKAELNRLLELYPISDRAKRSKATLSSLDPERTSE